MKRYQICAVMVSALGHPALLPDAAKQILMHHVCTTPRAAEIIAALNDAGIDACREEDMCSSKEGANKQVISSQADSLIKISRIWADFFPANTSNQPI
ncbi:hypothetical protein VAI73_21135 [Klebsiella pneumoniae]